MTELHCDNYATCNSTVAGLDTDPQTYARARARGWHIWHGETLTGAYSEVYLCDVCMRNRRITPEPVLEGQESLFVMEVIVEAPPRERR